MKKLLLTFAIILMAACNKNNTEKPATVGEWYATEMAGKSFKLGSQKNIDLIKQACTINNLIVQCFDKIFGD